MMRWFRKEKGDWNGHLDEGIGIGEGPHGKDFGGCQEAAVVEPRPRYDRVCHPRRRFSGNRNPGHHGVQAKVARALDRHIRWDNRLVSRLAGQRGQSTVEFAVVTASFLVIVIALSALWHALASGLLVDHALSAASHHLRDVPAPNIADVFRY